ncbi:MAG: DegT/DnrJ/EryC1/StrS family aminotransferase [Methanobrevibacter sp.]|jgi:hypothetical protein|nr:DegT/DnrJ/EryC1/StrS family aminotransferase [Methanobrevibacter sp.]
MELKYKQASKETRLAMAEIAENPSLGEKENSYSIETESKIIAATGHRHAKIVNSGNAAILTTMNAIEGPILIPDQGGWHGFKQIAKFLNKEVIKIKTDLGLITEESLENINIKEIMAKSQYKEPAIFLTSFAGYTAEQNMETISNWSLENNVLVVEDASGAITDNERKLANKKYSDIIIGSTSSPKVINVGDGGFISTNKQEIFEKSRLILKICKPNNITYKGIFTEIDHSSDNLKKTIESTMYMKNNLDNVVHEDKRGTNVIIAKRDPSTLLRNLKIKFNVGGKSIITICPNYNRLNIKGIAIEIKNLDPTSLTKENLDEMIEIIKLYQ